MKKNILLIPTTDNIIINWSDVYQFLASKGHSIYIISDNKLITSQYSNFFIKIDLCVMRLFQAESLNYVEIVILKLYLNVFAKYTLEKYEIDTVVVSNDNPIVQNVFVNKAKKLGVKTILHQAAGISKKPIKLSSCKKLKIRLRTLLFNESSSVNIGNDVDICLIQGRKWINYIDNSNFKIIGNEYYRILKNKIDAISKNEINELKCMLQVKDKKIVVFFSQPFKELSISSDENINKLYGELKKLESNLLNSGNYIFIFKPHPQEFYYKEFDFTKVIEEVDLNLLIASSDVCITVFSTMAMQSRIALKKTIGYLPSYLPNEMLNQMRSIFDATSDDIEEVFCLIDKILESKKQEITEVSDLSIDTKTIIEAIITI